MSICSTDRAALVQGDCWKVDAFKEVLIGNSLVYTIFIEHHLKQDAGVTTSKQQEFF